MATYATYWLCPNCHGDNMHYYPVEQPCCRYCSTSYSWDEIERMHVITATYEIKEREG